MKFCRRVFLGRNKELRCSHRNNVERGRIAGSFGVIDLVELRSVWLSEIGLSDLLGLFDGGDVAGLVGFCSVDLLPKTNNRTVLPFADSSALIRALLKSHPIRTGELAHAE